MNSESRLTPEWLDDFKRKTEERWLSRQIFRPYYGFQIQSGTKWQPGLSASAIREYEAAVGFEFSDEVRLFLSKMNGFDLPELNVHGDSGKPATEVRTAYRYPEDLEQVIEMMQFPPEDMPYIEEGIAEGLETVLVRPVHLLPIYSHRYVLCPPNETVVCSIVDRDAVVYSWSLRSYLHGEFLRA